MIFDIIATNYRGARDDTRIEAENEQQAIDLFAAYCEKEQPQAAQLWHILTKIDEFFG